ncbi:hypothetical protein BDR06DRAFT_837528, partial [Suillus hirtellus]
QEAKVAAKEQWQQAREKRSKEIVEWEDKEEARKVRNAMRKTKWKNEVAEWEAERDLAKQEKRRTHWKKPVLGPLEKSVPKPK